MTATDYLIATRRAIHRAGIGYSAYTVAMAIAAGRADTIDALAGLLGLSRKGIRDIVTRRSAHFFECVPDTRPVRYRLSPFALETLHKVQRHMPAQKPAPRRRRRVHRPEAGRRAQLLLEL